MFLKEITLHNYRQHKDLHVDFTGNMIAVTGRNGVGKSNFLGAIQFALTGEQPGFTKEDLLTWGESSGYVELKFSHNLIDCLIQRRIEKPAVTLKIGEDTYSGAKKVAEALEQVLQLDKDIFRQSVFVRQTEVESVLFTDPRDRELAFQRLIGLGDAAKHHKFLTEFIAALGEPKNLNDEIKRQNELIASQKESLEKLKAQAQALQTMLDTSGDAEQIQKEISVLQDRIGIIKEVLAKKVNLEAVKSRLAQLQTNEVKTKKDITPINKNIEDVISKLHDADMVARRNSDRKNAMQALEQAKNTLQGFPTDLDALVTEYENKKAERGTLKGRLDSLDRLLANAPDGNTCPLCGSEADHNIKEELLSEKADVTQKYNALSAWLTNHAGTLDAQRRRDEAQYNVESLEARVDSLGTLEPETDVEQLKTTLSELKGSLNEAISYNNVVAQEEAQLAELNSQYELATQQYAEIVKKLPGEYGTEVMQRAEQDMTTRINTLFNSLNTLSELKSQKAMLDGGINQVVETLAQAEEGLVKLNEINQENKIKSAKLQTITDVKDWFSYKNGPRVMTQSIMSLLTDETNKFLEQFGSPFSVIPIEEGMGFRCVFTDGRPMSDPPPEATMLSGGQKIQLAVAFRFAVYSMFAGKLGLLSLDEPTAYLDDETIARFADMLGKIHELAKNLNLQILISTHETQLTHVFDQSIVIGK